MPNTQKEKTKKIKKYEPNEYIAGKTTDERDTSGKNKKTEKRILKNGGRLSKSYW